MFDEDGGRHRAAVEDVERHGDNLGAVLLGKIRDRSDQAGAGPPQFMTGLMDRVLADDGAVLASAGLFKRAFRTSQSPTTAFA